MTNDKYMQFLASKAARAPMRGMEKMPAISGHLYPYQRASVEFMLRAGGSGLFLDTGLGKTLCELEWAAHAGEASNGRSLILTPLAVAWQIKAEADRFGYHARVIRDQSEAGEGINICNYDRLDQAVIERMGLKRAKRLGEVGSRGGGVDSHARNGTPVEFRDLLISIAETAKTPR